MLLLSCFELSSYFICYLHNNSTILFSRGFKTMLCNGVIKYFFKISQLILLLVTSLILLPCVAFPLFLYKWNFRYKWKKLNTSLEGSSYNTVILYLQRIFYKVRTKYQISKVIIPIIIIIMGNLSLIKNKSAIKSLTKLKTQKKQKIRTTQI